jgi:hypothetical protein
MLRDLLFRVCAVGKTVLMKILAGDFCIVNKVLNISSIKLCIAVLVLRSASE